MIMIEKERHRVSELMVQRRLRFDQLVESSGIDARVVNAILHQRYTPSPEQRERISNALGVARDQIIWGHEVAVELHIHAPI